MKVVVAGLNHKSAPLAIREKLACDADQMLSALRELEKRFPEREFVLLSTCNRVELYSACNRTNPLDLRTMAAFLADFRGLKVQDFQDFLYFHEDANAVAHLLTVASSLDSMVVGEGQIMAQVKDSYRLACTAGSTGKVLNRLFHRAFTVAKKVHTVTGIASGRISVPSVAVDLARQLFTDISSAKVIVIGAGEMGELIVRHLLHAGCKEITVFNRSFERGLAMAKRHGLAAQKWEMLDAYLVTADMVLASAAAQDYVLTKNSLRGLLQDNRKVALLLVDISVPRNIEPAVREIEGVHLYSMDELAEVAERNRCARQEDIGKAMEIVHEETDEFMDWFRARDLGPLIGKMKETFERISRNELERFFVGVRQDAACRDVLEPTVKRIVNKLVHCVIENVNVVAKEHGPAEAAKLVDSIVRRAEQISTETDT
jgi:glutamyl-tRNA reductase